MRRSFDRQLGNRERAVEVRSALSPTTVEEGEPWLEACPAIPYIEGLAITAADEPDWSKLLAGTAG